jgi:tetratricopeptide (TPR) repeat protein
MGGFLIAGLGPRRLRLLNGALAALFAAFAFLAVLFPLTNSDIWWHLAAGRRMVETGSFLYADPFSLTSEGPWIDLHWLFQLGAYAVHSVAGVKGLVLAKAFVFTCACLVFLLVAYGKETFALAASALAAAVFTTRFLVLCRPTVVSLVYLALFLLFIERFRRTQRARWLWALPAIQLLWTNTQGLFVLGPVTLLCYLAGDAGAYALRNVRTRLVRPEPTLDGRGLKPLGLAFLGTCAACLVSPYGPRAVALPFVLFSRIEPGLAGVYSRNVAENVPTWLLERESLREWGHLAWFGAAAVASFALTRRRLSPARLLLFAAFLYLGLIAKRNLPLYLPVAVTVAALNLNAVLEARRDDPWTRPLAEGLPLAGAAAAACAMLVAGIGIAGAAAREPSLLGLAPFRHPVEAAEVIAADDFEGSPAAAGEVFCSVRHGGYLIWRLYPPRKAFIDGRLVLRSRETFREYLALLDRPERFESYRRRHRLTRALLPTAVPRRYLGLVGHLYGHPGWRLIYADGATALFAYDPGGSGPRLDLSSREDVERIGRGLVRRHGGNVHVLGAARLNLAVLLLHLGSPERAEQVLRRVSSPGEIDRERRDEAVRYLARSLFVQGRLSEAEELSRELLEEDPEDTKSLNLMAEIHLERGELADALSCFRRTLGIDPFNAHAASAVGRIEERLGHPR